MIKTKTVDDYIKTFPKEVQEILEKIRQTVRSVAPDAEETISYQMPAFKYHGILIYFAAFKEHIGVYPPAPTALKKEVAKYANPKGNLRFPLEKPIPYDLIKKIVMLRLKENLQNKKLRD